MGKKSLLFAALLAMLGVCLILWPVLHGSRLQAQTTDAAQSFLDQQAEAPQYPELLAALQAYSPRLYAETQSGLVDLAACQAPAANLTAYGIADEVFGVLEIPAMDLTMPIYLGASDEHLAAGTAVLGQTSVPIGGDSTTAVIAGHRDWMRADYLPHNALLQLGDEVTVTNLWKKLTYTVTEISIIQPHEVEMIKIQPNRDLLTLLTCHPYASGGKQRYVAVCERLQD